MIAQPWRITLFGGLKAEQANRIIARFQTAKTGTLLAYLAYFPRRAHTRDELTEILWPGGDPLETRNRLRVALSSLRRQLEPPPLARGVVLEADRSTVGLRQAAFETDVSAFESALTAARKAQSTAQAREWLAQAVALYSGDLLHGYDEPWLLVERERLAVAYRDALRRLAEGYQHEGEDAQALDCALRLIDADPWEEQGYALTMRGWAAQGRIGDALRCYRAWERRCREELYIMPSPPVRAFAAKLKQSLPLAVATIGTTSPVDSHKISRPPVTPTSARVTFPPSIGLPSMPKLPIPLTRFFGRDSEVEHLAAWLGLGNSRLVTLTGMGGIGKTRFALEVAHRVAPSFPGGVVFVPLADVAHADLLPDAILRALGGEPARNSALDNLAAALPGAPTLLLLDSFEHLIEAGVGLLAALLQCAPLVTCLVTSRQTLALEGEHEFPLAPLPTPRQKSGLERLPECPSAQLFLDRAQAIQSDFQITPRNAAAIAHLCNVLEGIPLALELAASWTRILTPSQMLERLTQRFDLLVSRRREGSQRHQSLHAAIEWSYHSLSPDLQRFFRSLAVFRGGWSLAASGDVCSPTHACEYLDQLRERSLIAAELEEGKGQEPEMRCQMLETLREFATEQAEAAELAEFQSRHADYFLRLAEEAEPCLLGSEQAVWLARLEREQDNMRAALDNLCAHREGGERALRLTGALWRFWLTRGFLDEGRQHCARALAHLNASAPTPSRIKTLGVAGALAHAQGDYQAAQAWCEEQLQAARQSGNEAGEASALHRLGNVALSRADLETARTLYQDCVTIRRRLGDQQGIGLVLNNLGIVAYERGEHEEARVLYEEFLTVCRDMGDRRGTGGALSQLGILARAQGEFAAAMVYLTESLAIRRELGDKQGTAFALANLANVAFDENDFTHAIALSRESLVLLRELGDRGSLAAALRDMANLACMQAQMERAARLYGAAEALRDSTGAIIPSHRRAEYEANVAAARAVLGEAACKAAWTLGRALTLDQALDLALNDTPPAP